MLKRLRSFFSGAHKFSVGPHKPKWARQHPRFRAVRLESLEVRQLLAIVDWTGGGDGTSWSDASNWSSKPALPGAADDVVINAVGSPTIVHAAGADTIHSLSSANALTLSGGSLTVATTLEVDNTFDISGGTLKSAIVVPGTGVAALNISAGTLDGVTLESDATVTNNSSLTVLHGLTLDGALTVGTHAAVVLPGIQQATNALTVNGLASFATGDTVTLDATPFQSTTLIAVNGTLAATGTSFSQTGSYSTSLSVNSSGELVASGDTFAVGSMSINNGAVVKATDLANNVFNLTLGLPAIDVAMLSAAGGGSDNRSFRDIDILAGTLTSGALNLNLIGTQSTTNLRYVFPGSFTVAAGASLNVGSNVPVLLPGIQQATNALTVNGSASFATGDTVTLDATPFQSTTLIAVNGTLAATGTSFSQTGSYSTSLSVNSSGELVASGDTFAVGSMSINNGAVVKATDLANNVFNLTLGLPAIDVAMLSAAGGGSDNRSFRDIDILAGTLTSGALNLNLIGTQSTTNLRYVFPGSFTVAAGASLNVGSNVPVLLPGIQQATNALTVNGSASFATGDTVTLDATPFQSTTLIAVNGTLAATGTSFSQTGSYSTSLSVNSSGELVASGDTFAVGSMSINNGAVVKATDLANNVFNLTLGLPAIDVAMLSAAGGGSDNRSFRDIDILAGTLTSGALNLNLIGTQSTTNLRYVFPGSFTVAAGASLNVGSNVPVLLPGIQQATNALTVNGSASFATGDTVTLDATPFQSTTLIAVNGTLAATGTSLSQTGSYFTSLSVNSSGELVASGDTFAVGSMTINNGAVVKATDLSDNTFNLTLGLPAIDVAMLSAAGGGSDNRSFRDIDILAGTLTSGALNLNLIGTQSTTNLRYVFPGSFTVAAGASLNVGSNVPVLLPGIQQATNALTVNGLASFATGDTVTLDATPFQSTTLIAVNGTLAATGTSLSQTGSYFTSLSVNSSGELVASGDTFAVGSMTINNGAVVKATDLSDNTFNLTLGLPAIDVAMLSAAGGGSDNRSFRDIDILAGTLTSGALNLNLIGTQSTTNLRYVFPGSFTVAAGASLNVGSNVPVLLPGIQQATNALTVNGLASFATGDTVTLDATPFQSTTLIAVNGTLAATGTSFSQTGSYSTSLSVNSSGELVASGDTFAVGSMSINNGAVVKATDLANNVFNLTLGLPAIDVAMLSAAGGGSDNRSFRDIDILAGTLTSGALNLNLIGTQSTTNLRYVFPGSFTVAAGASLNVGSNVPMLLLGIQQAANALTVNGSASFAAGNTVTLDATPFQSTTLIAVNGTLIATGISFVQAGGYTTELNVNSGGQLVASGDTFALTQVNVSNGNFLALGGTVSLPTININGTSEFSSSAATTIVVTGNLLGIPQSANLFTPNGTLQLSGPGTAAAPQLFQAMSVDHGNNGFINNYAYGALDLGNTTYVKLQGGGSQAVYVNSISVPVGTTLNLNGLHLYAHVVQIAGTVTGGTITQVTGGQMAVDVPVAGDITTIAPIDQWTFNGVGGDSITVSLDPGSGAAGGPAAPTLQWAQVELLDSSSDVLATATSTAAGAVLTLGNLVLPADATYTIQAQAAPAHSASVGNYVLAVTDVASSVAALPALTTSVRFPVSWSGGDGAGEFPIALYEVFVSIDGGAFVPWQTTTAQTSATYTGLFGHTYAFFSVATDQAGNRQPTPAAAQATTTLSGNLALAAPSVTATQDVWFTGAVATFTDTDPNANAAELSATVVWGDGATTAGTISGPDANGTFTVSGSHFYVAETAGLTASVTVSDAAGQLASAAGTANVADAPLAGKPRVISALAGVGFSGAAATFTDADFTAAITDYTATIDWGDGVKTGGTLSAAFGVFTVSGSHTYATPANDVPVVVTISDVGGAAATVHSLAEVAQATLSAAAVSVAATEGATFSGAVADFTDAGQPSDFSAVVTWDDGSQTPATITGADGYFTVSGAHLYLEAGKNLPVVVAVADSDGESATVNGTANVADAALTGSLVTISALAGVGFAGAVATFTDADPNGAAGDYTATIDWGDGAKTTGTLSAASGAFTVSGSHNYATPASDVPIVVTILDVGGGSATVISQANVTPAALSAAAVTVAATEGTTFSGTVATFTDAGQVSDFSAVVTWDDGTHTTATISGAGGHFTVVGAHVYPKSGQNLSVVVAITDTDGESATVTGTANIADAALSATVAALSATEGSTLSGTLATFTDANPGAAAGDFTAIVDWGDKSALTTVSGSQITETSGTFSVPGSHVYADDGTFTLTVTISDVGGATTTINPLAAIHDATLDATASAVSATEGTRFIGTLATFSDANAGAAAGDFTAVVDWGDKTALTTISGSQITETTGAFSVPGNHIYVDDGGFTLTVTISDVGGATATVNPLATVYDAALSATAGAVSATEGSAFSGTPATFTDANAGATAGDFTAVIDWGDKTALTTVSGSQITEASGTFSVPGSHVYADAGSYTLTVTISDAGGATATVNPVATVRDAALSATAAPVASATEGSRFIDTVATFTDANPGAVAGDFTAVVDWGDKSALTTVSGSQITEAAGTFSVPGSHVYADEGSYTLTVTISDVGGATATVNPVATIDDAALSATAAPSVSATEGSTFNGALATFSDANPGAVADDFTAVIDWGDKTALTTISGSQFSEASGTFSVPGSHVYAEEGTFTLTVTISDVGGATASVNSLATVDDATLSATAAPSVSATHGGTFSGTLATFTDANPGAAPGEFTAVVDWGDTTALTTVSGSQITEAGGTFSVSGSHVYADDGSYALTVTISDAGGATVTLTIAAPDLSLNTATMVGQTAPFEAVLGTPLAVSWTVANLAPVAAPGTWHDAVYVSNTDVLDGTAQLIQRFDESSHSGLASQASYTESENITLPSGTIGQRFLLFVTDDGQEQPESNTANDVFAVPITVTGADLAVASANAPGVAPLGSMLPVTWTVVNQGNADATATWNDAVYFSNSLVLDGSAIFAGSFAAPPTSPLGAGQSYQQSVKVTVPNAAAGDGYLLIATDAGQTQAESDTANDVVALPIQLVQADLVANILSGPASADFGQAINVSWTVTNGSTAALNQPWSDSVYVSASSTFDLATATLLTTVAESGQLPLAANGSYTQTAQVTVPLTAASANGTYYLYVLVDSQNQVEETNKNNNVAGQSISLALPALPNLSPTNFVVPADGLAGQGFDAGWTDQNTGTATGTGPWRDDVYISKDQNLADGTLIGQFTFDGSLAPGGSVARTQHFTYPGTAGNYSIIVQADADGGANVGPNATDDTAASAAIDVSPVPLPDLTVSVATPTATFASGTSVPITYTVTNSGAAPTAAPFWYDYVFVSQDPNLSFAGYGGNPFADQTINNVVVLQEHVTPMADVNPSFLDIGQSYTQTADVTLPIDATGTWYAYVATDGLGGHFKYQSMVSESNEANNLGVSGGFNVALSPPPDLAVTAAQAPAQVFSGQPMNLSWTVANKGAGPVPPITSTWSDQVFMSASQSLDASAVLLGTFTHTGALAAGASYTDRESVTLPVGISGDFYFIVKTNAGGDVFENGATANDVLSTTVTSHVNLTPPPDLAVASVTSPATALAGHSLTIGYEVDNAGAGATPNTRWTDSFYLASGAVLDTKTDLHLGDVVHSGALADAGATGAADNYVTSATFTLRNGLTGTYHVFVVTDSQDQVFEVDKTNNTAEASDTIVVTSPTADLAVSSVAAVANGQAGQAVNVSWTVTNQGAGDTAVSDWVDMIYAAASPTLGATRTLLDVVHHHGLLGPGGSYTASDLVTLPISLSGGAYNLFVYTNAPVLPSEDPYDPPTGPGGYVYEPNATNSVSQPAAIAISQPLPDLTVSGVTAPATAATGASVTVSWTETNAGAAATNSDHWYDDVYLSPTQTFDASTAVYLGSFYHNLALAAGAADPVSATFSIPQDLAAPASDFFIVRADRPSPTVPNDKYVNLVYESDETNNDAADGAATTISAAATPDLTTSAVTPTASPVVTGQTIDVSWTVTNAGAATVPTAAWNDAVYLSLDTTLDPSSDIFLGNFEHTGGLAAGAQYTGGGSFQIPLGLAGNYFVLVAADAGQVVYERTGSADRVAASAAALTITLQPPVNLVAGTFTVPSGPASALLGGPLTVTFSVSNSSATAAAGDWYDALYLSPTTTFQPGDPLLGEVHHTGGLAAHGSYGASFQATMPGVGPGTYYIILRSDIRGQVLETTKTDNLSASASIALDAAVLTPGAPGAATPATGTLDQDQSAFYKVTVPAGDTLSIALADPAAADVNGLYASFGALPSRAQSDFQGNQPFAANQVVTVPTTQAGTYYVLVYAQSVTSPPENYSLTATLVPFSVSAAKPATVGNAGPATIEIDGARFNRDTTFQLIDSQSNVVQAATVQVRDASTAFATFDLTGAAVGAYTVQATQSDGTKAQLTGGLTVAVGLGGQFVAHVAVPSITLAGRQNVFNVAYDNTGDASVGAPLLTITSPTNTPMGLMAGDVYANRDLNVLAVSPDGPAGILRPGAVNTLPVLFQADATVGTPYQFDVSVTTTDDPFPIDWSVIQPLVSDQFTQLPVWPAAFADLQQLIGPTWGDYVKMLDRNATLLVSQTGVENSDPLALLDLEAQQAVADVSTSIRGTVHAADPSIEIAGVQVSAIDARTGNVYAVRSLADGSFVFPQVAAGTYQLTFQGAVVTSGGDVTAVQGQQLTGVLSQLAAGETISGHVLDQATGLPLPNAEVNAFDANGAAYSATADAAGAYSLTGLPAGTYRVVGSADGYAATTISNVAVATSTTALDVTLAAQGVITGEISLPGGVFNPGTLLVTATPVGSPNGTEPTAADPVIGLNSFALDGLPAGTYDIRFSLPGFLPQTVSGFSVGAGQTVDLGNVSLTPSAVISGQITSGDSALIASGVQVGAYQGTTLVASAQADASGKFTIGEGLPAGTFTVQPITSEFFAPQTVSMTSGQTLNGVAIDVEPGGSIAGIVSDSVSGAPLAGVIVSIAASDGSVSNTSTDDNGDYQLTGLNIGEYTVFLNHDAAAAGSDTVRITSLSGPATQANLQMQTEGRLQGRLLTAGGTPIAGGSIQLLPTGGTTPAAVTTSDDQGNYAFWFTQTGTFDIHAVAEGAGFAPVTGVQITSGGDVTQDLTAGTATLQVQAQVNGSPVQGAEVALYFQTIYGPAPAGTGTSDAGGSVNFANLVAGTYVAAVVDGGLGASAQATLTSGQPGTLTISLAQQATVTGAVTDITSKPIAGATVVLTPATGAGQQWFATTAPDGDYAIGNVPFDTYNVTVIAQGFQGSFTSGVSITAAAATENFSLTPSPNLVEGHVVDENHTPVAGALVEVLDALGHLVGLGITAADGGYSIGGETASGLRISVTALGLTSSDPLTFNDPGGPVVVTVPDYTLPTSGVIAQLKGLKAPADTLSAQPQAWFQDVMEETPVSPILAPNPDDQDIEPWVQQVNDQLVTVALPEARNAAALEMGKAAVVAQAARAAQEVFLNNVAGFIQGAREFADDAYQQMLSVLEVAGPGALTLAQANGPSGTTTPTTSAVTALADVLGQLSTAVAAAETADDVDSLDIALANLDTARSNVVIVVQRLETRWTALAKAADEPAIAALLSGAVSNLAAVIGTGTPFGPSSDPFAESKARLVDVSAKYGGFVDASNAALSAVDHAWYLNDLSEAIRNDGDGDNDADDEDRQMQPPPGGGDGDDDGDDQRNNNQAAPDGDGDQDDQGNANTNINSNTNTLADDDADGIGGGGKSDRPKDPNAIVGPDGFGDEDDVPIDLPMDYEIDFENLPAAGLPAQTVEITDHLDAHLNANSFRLGAFSFGGMIFSPPANSASYQTTINETATLGFNVIVTATVNVQTRTATWTFQTIDPATGTTPLDATHGLLPPDNANGIGEGFVNYSVDPLKTDVTGDRVDAQATIKFDTQPDLNTPTIFNTIDAGAALTSTVTALPATEPTTTFNVSWGGGTGPQGSAVAGYTVYISDNGGPFTVFLSNTLLTQAPFTGQQGHTYRFYSLADDNAGNQQAPSTAVTFTTTVGDAIDTPLAATVSPTEGAAFSGTLATFTGGNTHGVASDFTAQIDWGDLTMPGTASITGTASGGYTVRGSHTYAEENASGLPLKIVIADPMGNKTTVTSTVEVADAALTLTPATIAATEGVAYLGTVATFTDANPAGAAADYTATIDWGDTSALTTVSGSQITVAGGGFTVPASHVYVEDGSYTLTVTIGDAGGATATAHGTAHVADAPLTSVTGATFAATEGVAFSGQVATFFATDPQSAAGALTVSINWGDGTVSAGTVSAAGGTGFSVVGNHSYAEDGANQPVTVTITDPGGATATANGTARVADAPLTGVMGMTIAPTEGVAFSGQVAMFTATDPQAAAGAFTVSIKWGDGGVSAGTVSAAGGAGFSVVGGHTYAEDGANQPVTVTITDPGGASATANGMANVADAPLTVVTGMTIAPTEGVAFSGQVATFTAADPQAAAASFTVSIKWGDGGVSTGTVSAAGGANFSVIGGHTYAEDGANQPVTVTITDPGGASAAANGMANVGDAPLTSVTGMTIAPTEGVAFSGQLATFTAADPQAAAGTFTVSINWGDGSVSAGTVSAAGGAGFSVVGGHTYAEDGANQSVTVTITDPGGVSATAHGTANVADAPLTGVMGMTIAPTEGVAFSGQVAMFTATDPQAAAASFTVSINWGDGGTSTGTVSAAGGTNFSVVDGHTYAEDGANQPVTVTITDPGGASATAHGTANVADAPLASVTGMTIAPTEGVAFSGQVATFTATDPQAAAGTFTVSINWGDGGVSAGTVSASGGSNFSVVGGHTYAEDGANQPVTVTITDPGGASATAHGTANVADAALTATGLTITAGVNITFSGMVATFSDADPAGVAGDFTATIDWGDGTSTTAGTIADPAGGGFAVSGSHEFTALSGGLPLKVVITDAGGATAGATGMAVVVPPLAVTARSITVTEGAAFTATVATFTGTKPGDTASDFTATIAWGDGGSGAGSISGTFASGFTVTATHAYVEEAAGEPLVIVVNGPNGSVATAHGTASVTDAALTAAGLTISAGVNTTFSGMVATFSDADPAGVAGDFTSTIDWGDGTSATAGTVAATASGGFAVSGSHAYVVTAKGQVKVTIQDEGGAQAQATTPVTFGTPSELYVSAVYEGVLGRAPDAGGLAYWSQLLDSGTAVSSVAAAIVHSDEYYGNVVIRPDYLRLLGRAADDGGVAYWTTQMDIGATDQELEADLVSSPEFYKAAGGTNTAWIDAVYKLLLERAADAGGEKYWNDQLDAGQTLNQVAQGIAGSQENNAQLINEDYFHYLGRTADQGGLDFWLAQFAAGETNEDVIAGFTGSAEYYMKHTGQ